MLANIAPLGYDPSKHGRKPQKRNPLLKWLAEQEHAQQNQPKTRTKAGSSALINTLPWCRPNSAGKASLKQVTESFYAQHVKPAIDGFLQQCFLERPKFLAPFACRYFANMSTNGHDKTIDKSVAWPQYEETRIQPARLFLIQPLVHLLLQARPASVSAYTTRVFQVYATLCKDALGDQFEDGIVPLKKTVDALSPLLWSIDDEQLELVDSILKGINTEHNSVRLVEFCIRVPLEISERLCDALLNGQPRVKKSTMHVDATRPENSDLEQDAEVESKKDEVADEILKRSPVAADALKFKDNREQNLMSRLRYDIMTVMRDARLATQLPRTKDDDAAFEYPEADREAEQLRMLVHQLSQMAPERPDWLRDDLPQLLANLKLLVALPQRTIAKTLHGHNDEDDALTKEVTTLRDIVERGVRVCEVLLAGLGPTIERQSAGNQVDEVVAAAKLQNIFPGSDISQLEDEDEELYREIVQLRKFCDKLADAEPQRHDWRTFDAPQLKSEIELYLALPQRKEEWEDFIEEMGLGHPIIREVESLRNLIVDGSRMLAQIEQRNSKVPEGARRAIAAAQLFGMLKAPDLEWLEQENQQVLQTIVRLREMVEQVGQARIELPKWRDDGLKRLVSTLRIQDICFSKDLEDQIFALDADELATEYTQLTSILTAARDALSTMAAAVEI